MAKRSVIIGAKRVVQTLAKLRMKSKRENNVIVQVGYTANYALFVHEAPGTLLGKGIPRKPSPPHKGKYWDPQGVAIPKFLERPFRENRGEIIATARKEAQKTKSLTQGLIEGGKFLMRKSQQVVPVEHGNLKASAFTRKE